MAHKLGVFFGLLPVFLGVPGHAAPGNGEVTKFEVAEPIASIELEASQWTQRLLAAPYRPPAGSKYVWVPAGKWEACDVLRLQYAVGEDTLLINQTRAMLSIRVSRSSHARSGAEIQTLARRLFAGAAALQVREFKDSAHPEGFAVRATVKEAPWLGTLTWFRRAQDVRFTVLKSVEPQIANREATLADNQYWFSERPTGPRALETPVTVDEVTQVLTSLSGPDHLSTPSGFRWARDLLAPGYAPPKNLGAVAVPVDEVTRRAIMSYGVGTEIVTLAEGAGERAIWIDFPALLGFAEIGARPPQRKKSVPAAPQIESLLRRALGAGSDVSIQWNPGEPEPQTGTVVVRVNRDAATRSLRLRRFPGRLALVVTAL